MCIYSKRTRALTFGHPCQDEAPDTEARSCWSLFLEGVFGIKKGSGKLMINEFNVCVCVCVCVCERERERECIA